MAQHINDNLNDCRFHVSLDTTSHCNLRCRHCWMDAVRAKGYYFKNEVMPFDLFKRIADQFPGRCQSFGLSCGYEPLINKEFPRYVAYAVELGLPDVHFYTNGTLLTEKMAEEIVAAGPKRIVFSLEGTTEESFQDIRRGAKLEQFTRALDMIHREKQRQGRHRPVLRFNWVMMPRNLQELPDLARLADEHHCAEIFFIPHIRWEDAGLQENSLLEGDIRAARESIDAFKQQCAALGIHVFDEMLRDALPTTPQPSSNGNGGGLRQRLQHLLRGNAGHQPFEPYCRQPWEMMIVTSTGTIMPCSGTLLDRVYGDFSRQTLEEMWESAEFRALREGLAGRGPLCSHCRDCPHNRLNSKQEDFHRPRPLDAELLRQVIPTIARKQAAKAASAEQDE